MALEAQLDRASLHKSAHTTSERSRRQEERRHLLLKEQQERRNQLIDQNRPSLVLKEQFSKKSEGKRSQPRSYRPSHKNSLQLSEWLMEKPDDLYKWYLRPCPKGTRCLVVATDGKTEVYNKRGHFISKFHSVLPGDFRGHDLVTMLDCVFVPNSSEYFVLDVLTYGAQDLTDCDAEFRFYWIHSRIQEEELDKKTPQNQFIFRTIANCECGDEEALSTLLSQYPLWPNNCPELDGFLFYHKESSYVSGRTPLVGWLFSFMLPEVLNVPHLNENYLEKPNGYTNYLTYIKEFDDTLQKKRNRKPRTRTTEKMDMETVPNVIAQQRNLEEDDMSEEISVELNSVDMIDEEVELQ